MSSLPATALGWAHPLVRDWFVGRFGSPTEPQEQGWPHILARRTTLIAAPTGSGKTLAAFLACIDRLVRQALAGELQDVTEVVYVSPLKALGNDIQRNLEVPLGEILQLAGERGLLMPQIRTAVRTGDTLMKDRQAMLRRPPHILVTTPESLYILLTAERSRAILRKVDTVIVDEIHAVAGDKRGAHLALSLERLDALVESAGLEKPVRIGLSATQKPIEQIAAFLSGSGEFPVSSSQLPAEDKPLISLMNADEEKQAIDQGQSAKSAVAVAENRELVTENCIAIVDVGHKRELDLQIEVPGTELGPVSSNEQWAEMYDRIAELVRQHRSTLVFVNTRRLAERVAHHLGERLGEEAVAAHHGSLSRKLRLAAERKLKAGELSVLVATASLQLGIDIGTVDLVIQIGSPRAIAVALQRIGRAGHWRGAIPRGRLLVTTRDELVECAALVRAIHRGELDRILIPEAPLDILAQQIVAECAATGRRLTATDPSAADGLPSTSDGCDEDELFALVRRAYPYRSLPREEFDAIVRMLSEGIAARRGRFGAYLHRDQVNRRLRARRGARMIAITSGGAIPETGLYTVVAVPEGTVVGTVDEDFAVESLAGDIILLGNTSWQIRRVESNASRILVEDAHGQPPNIPFWRGEAPARTEELSAHVAELRQKVSDLLPTLLPEPVGRQGWATQPDVRAAVEWLKAECGLDDSGAEQLIAHIITGRAVLGAVPTQDTIIAERFFDEGGGMQLVIHSPFGGRVNRAWGLSLRKRFCRSFNFELQAAATDDGLNIALAEQHSFPLADVFQFLAADTVQPVLEQAVLTGSPYFATRFRWDATRALALQRFRNGKKIPPQIHRMQADDLMASVFPDVAACQENIEGDIKIPDHPLVREVMKDVLTEAMDLDGLRSVLRGIEQGTIRCVAVDTPIPSQFSHEILNSNPYAYLDDAPLEERRARAVDMRRVLPDSVLQQVGGLDAEAIEQVRAEAWPDVRDADELHDVLQTLVAVPVDLTGAKALDHTVALSGGLKPAASTVAPAVCGGVNEPCTESCSGETISQRLQMSIGATVEAPGFSPANPARVGFRALAPVGSPIHVAELIAARRLGVARVNQAAFAVAAERAAAFRAIYPEAVFDPAPAELASSAVERSDALLQMLTGWMQHLGPVSAPQLASLLHLPEPEMEQTLLRLESTGAILRGNFTPSAAKAAFSPSAFGTAEAVPSHDDSGELRSPVQAGTPAPTQLEFCDRRLLARIHRLTVGRLRKEIEPVTEAQFMRWLLRWQHVAAGTQVEGERGTLEILQQLQGFEIAANAWERHVLAARVKNFDPEVLDRLCLIGAVGWGRLSPHPATLEDSSDGRRRVLPTSVAPITFFVREECDWMQPRADGDGEHRGLSDNARDLLAFLRQRGASFFPDIVRGSAKPKAEVESALWELVAAGLVTADGFENLRSLLERRNGKGRHAGRWSLLYAGGCAEREKSLEATCRMLLNRYGVVFRELLARESVAWKWRELAMTFRRLEDRGEIRGGRFVSGFLGEQFALPVAVESLRASRKQEPSGETITLSATDPLNLVGIIVPGERVAAISGKTITLRDGTAPPQAAASA